MNQTVDWNADHGPLIDVLRSASKQYGTPCYVYILGEIFERAAEIERAFGGRFEISYAVKANPNRRLLEAMAPIAPFLDVSSAGEIGRALECGYSADRLTFSGPGKTVEELDFAVRRGCGAIIVESPQELQDLDRICSDRERELKVVVRINPDRIPRGFGVSMAARACQFGVDEQDMDDLLALFERLSHVKLVGFHIYSGTQCLDSKSIIDNFANYIQLFRKYASRCELLPKLLIFGSGIGIPYTPEDVAVDLAIVAAEINPMLDDLRIEQRFRSTRCLLEIGRLLVGQAGYFVTRVIRGKRSRGVDLWICDGGLNHHLAACGHFGSVIHRNYPMFQIPTTKQTAERAQKAHLVGPLCTTIDVLGRDVNLPTLDVGDLVVVQSSGAYGLTASPVYFISHPPPHELLVTTDGNTHRISDITEIVVAAPSD